MNINGDLIKTTRKKLQFTQAELAKDICNQATISVIENRSVCDSLEIVDAICSRLGLALDQVIEESYESHVNSVLKVAEELCAVSKYEEANLLLEKEIDIANISNTVLMVEVYYYLGITYLIGHNELDKALFYFYEIREMSKERNLFEILSINGVGICYELKKQYDFAKVQYDRSIELIESGSYVDYYFINRIYYSAAKFYSSIKEYRRAVDLCNKGIAVNKRHHTTFCLEYLYYEKACNLFYLNDGTYVDWYSKAQVIAEFNDNAHVMDKIRSDLNLLEAN